MFNEHEETKERLFIEELLKKERHKLNFTKKKSIFPLTKNIFT